MGIVVVKPEMLSLLFVIPLLILIHFVSLRLRSKSVVKFANFEAISKIKGVDFYSKNIVILILSILTVIFLVLAASGLGMQKGLTSSSFSFVIAIDNSQSMSANDFLPTRLDAAKELSEEFVSSLPAGTEMAIVSFSGAAFTEQEMTSDKDLLNSGISNIDLSSVGGTDVYSVVALAAGLLSKKENKAMIFLSDGQINAGNLSDAISFAIENKMIVNSMGIGTVAGGETAYGFSKLDENTLKSLSFGTQGKYFNATNRAELESAFKELYGIKLKNIVTDLSSYLLMIALALFAIEFILINTRLIALP